MTINHTLCKSSIFDFYLNKGKGFLNMSQGLTHSPQVPDGSLKVSVI